MGQGEIEVGQEEIEIGQGEIKGGIPFMPQRLSSAIQIARGVIALSPLHSVTSLTPMDRIDFKGSFSSLFRSAGDNKN